MAVIFNLTSVSLFTPPPGAEDDLRKVTQMAFDQIKVLGMNERIGHLSFPKESEENTLGTKPYSKELGRLIDNVSAKD